MAPEGILLPAFSGLACKEGYLRIIRRSFHYFAWLGYDCFDEFKISSMALDASHGIVEESSTAFTRFRTGHTLQGLIAFMKNGPVW